MCSEQYLRGREPFLYQALCSRTEPRRWVGLAFTEVIRLTRCIYLFQINLTDRPMVVGQIGGPGRNYPIDGQSLRLPTDLAVFGMSCDVWMTFATSSLESMVSHPPKPMTYNSRQTLQIAITLCEHELQLCQRPESFRETFSTISQ
jgi:hypothetical protein